MATPIIGQVIIPTGDGFGRKRGDNNFLVTNVRMERAIRLEYKEPFWSKEKQKPQPTGTLVTLQVLADINEEGFAILGPERHDVFSEFSDPDMNPFLTAYTLCEEVFVQDEDRWRLISQPRRRKRKKSH